MIFPDQDQGLQQPPKKLKQEEKNQEIQEVEEVKHLKQYCGRSYCTKESFLELIVWHVLISSKIKIHWAAYLGLVCPIIQDIS